MKSIKTSALDAEASRLVQNMDDSQVNNIKTAVDHFSNKSKDELMGELLMPSKAVQ